MIKTTHDTRFKTFSKKATIQDKNKFKNYYSTIDIFINLTEYIKPKTKLRYCKY
jgi:hypothetical protein